jgi:hypothetical protein
VPSVIRSEVVTGSSLESRPLDPCAPGEGRTEISSPCNVVELKQREGADIQYRGTDALGRCTLELDRKWTLPDSLTVQSSAGCLT